LLAADALIAYRGGEKGADGEPSEKAMIGALLEADSFAHVRAIFIGLGGKE
jgi:hypothetical protein